MIICIINNEISLLRFQSLKTHVVQIITGLFLNDNYLTTGILHNYIYLHRASDSDLVLKILSSLRNQQSLSVSSKVVVMM